MQLALVQAGHACNAPLLETLAGRLSPAQALLAVTLFKRLANSYVETCRDSAYEDALRVVPAALAKMDEQTQAVWCAELRARFRAKRNFIRGLDSLRR